MFKPDLRLLIVLLGLAVGLVTFINAVLSSYQTERDLLMAQTLEANRVYAAKQAASTELFCSTPLSNWPIALVAWLRAGKMPRRGWMRLNA